MPLMTMRAWRSVQTDWLSLYDLNIRREDSEYGRVTVSLGYTTDTSDLDKMIDKADAAMYRAKTNGKNQAVSYERRDLYNEKLV